MAPARPDQCFKGRQLDAEVILMYMPDVHPRVAAIATVLALIGAIMFTEWYPERAKRPALG